MSLAVIHRVRSSITWKFILLFTIILSVIQGTIGWITHAEMSRSTQREAERLNLQILKQANLNLSRYYQQYENIFTLTDSSADFLRWMQADPEDAFVLQTSALSIDEHTLRPYFRAHPEIVSITMYNTNGVQKIILTDRSNTRLIPRLDYRLTEDVDVEALPPGRLLQQVSAKPHYMTRSATVGPEYVITFLKKYEYRNASAVIAIDVTLDPTLEILQEMSLVEGGLGLVIDADGTIIADPTGEAMLQPLPPDVFAGIRDSPAGTYYDANGHQMLFYEEISRSDGWKLIISTPHAYLTSSVESIRNTTLLVSVLGMAAAVALIVAVSSSYIRRIVKLRRMMRLTEMGSFHHRVSRITEHRSGISLVSGSSGALSQGLHEDLLQGRRKVHLADAGFHRAGEGVIVDSGGAVHHERRVDVARQVGDTCGVQHRPGLGHAMDGANGHGQRINT